MKKLLFLLTALSLNCFALQHKLATVTNSENKEYQKLYLETDESGAATTLIAQNFNKEDQLLKVYYYDYEEINQNGAVLFKAGGHDVLVVENIHFESQIGGSVILDYLENAISGKRSSIEIGIDKKEQEWRFYNLQENEFIENIHFIAKKTFGQPVGIKKIELN